MSARLRRARWCACLLLLAAAGVAAQSDPAEEGSKVKWGPMPEGWSALRVQGESVTTLPGEAVDTLGSHYFVLRSVKPGAWGAVIEIRLSPKKIDTLEQFAQEFAGHGMQREFDVTTFNGHPALHARNKGQVANYHDWLIRIPVRGGQPWVATQMSCAFSRGPGRDDCESRRAELEKVLATIEFNALPPSRLRASIALPPDLKPGDVVSPSAVVVDAEGRPPKGEVGVVWTIGGAQRNSIVWDGTPLRIHLQASADGQALTADMTVPAYAPAPAPGAPAAPAQPPHVSEEAGPSNAAGGVPGLGGIGGLPGPRNTTEGLVGTLGPAALGLLGALLSGLLNAPRTPPPPSPPEPKRRRPRKGKPGGDEGGDGEEPADPPPAPAPLDPGAHARDRLDHMRRIADRTGNAELRAAIEKAAARGFGPDGKLIPDAWREAQKEVLAARDRAFKKVDAPNSWLRDVIGVGAGAVGQGIVEGGKAAGSMVAGLGRMAIGGVSGVRAIGDAVLNPRMFVRGASEGIGRWADKNAATEKRGFSESMRDGRVGDALVYLGMGAVKAGADVGGKAVGFVKREILPWDELSSLVDKKASLEEKLWAVPAAAAKLAGLLTMGQSPTTQPATAWGRAIQNAVDRYGARGLASAAETAAGRVSQLESRLAAAERAAARSGGAGVQGVLASTKKALEKARTAQNTAEAAHRAELLSREAMRGRDAFQNFQQAQRALNENPTLAGAIDDALVKNNGGSSLYDLRSRGLMGQDTHTLMTARRLQLQDHVVNNATKRIVGQEVRALQAQGAKIPRRFDTFNATQGSRSRISGSNVNADFDQTVMGLKNVTRERAEAIVRQECKRVGMTQPQLDVNIYRPSRGLMDVRGAAPNSQRTLENIGQTSGTSGYHQVHVGRDGKAYVGNHVSSAQGREGVLAGRRTMDPPPGMSRDKWLSEGMWEGHQGAPVQVPKAQWPAVRQTQIEGLHHAFERGDMNQMVKYANRGRSVGMTMDDATSRLVRSVAGQKDPALAAQMLRNAGVRSPADLMQRFGLKP